MSHTAKSLVRRIEALESTAREAAPQPHNQLLEMSITAMAGAWTPDEVEAMLAAAERSKLDELPDDLRRRWVQRLDCISLQRFGQNFGALLASPSSNTKPPASPACESDQVNEKKRKGKEELHVSRKR
jgi:hypothetical protein